MRGLMVCRVQGGKAGARAAPSPQPSPARGEGAGPWRTIAGWDPLHTSLAKARAAPPCPYVTCVTHVPGLICYLCCRFADPRGRGLGERGTGMHICRMPCSFLCRPRVPYQKRQKPAPLSTVPAPVITSADQLARASG